MLGMFARGTLAQCGLRQSIKLGFGSGFGKPGQLNVIMVGDRPPSSDGDARRIGIMS
jgi:hypothetical protein